MKKTAATLLTLIALAFPAFAEEPQQTQELPAHCNGRVLPEQQTPEPPRPVTHQQVKSEKKELRVVRVDARTEAGEVASDRR